MGVANSEAKLYDEELQQLAAAYPDQFRLDYALSREQQVCHCPVPSSAIAAGCTALRRCRQQCPAPIHPS